MDNGEINLPPEPHQPKTFKFPKRTFGQKNPVQRSFQSAWFTNRSWLHYDESSDLAYCHVCATAHKQGKLTDSRFDKTYITKGYCNWKDALTNFKKHEASNCHKEAMERLISIPKTTKDIGEALSAQYSEEKQQNRECLLKIMSSIRYLARQGLALRGDGDEEDGNFNQLLKLRCEDDPQITQWLAKKRWKYTCGEVQNEIMQTMATSIMRETANEIRNSPFFTIMADETADKSNREQLVIVLRHVDSSLHAQEEFIGLHKVNSIDANTITRSIQDCLIRLNLSVQNCRGQCYDGASAMSGAKNGVAKQILDLEKRAVYTHCYGHALNLAVGDCVKQSKVMRDALDTTHEISKLLKYSPKRDAMFEELKKELAPDTPGFRTLCPTRWTVRANSLKSVVDNYMVLRELWEDCRDDIKDSEMKARVIGVDAQMKNFEFLFGVMMGHLLLRHTDNLSKTLQDKEISAAEGQSVAKMTVDTLAKMRSEESFGQFWDLVNSRASSLGVDEPILPRKRKMPRRYEQGDAAHFYPPTPKDLYRQHYFEVLDLAVTCIKDRFEQPGFAVYRNTQELLVKAANSDFKDYSTEFQFVTDFYAGDVDSETLKVQLAMLRTHFAGKTEEKKEEQTTFSDVLAYIRSLSKPVRCMFSEVVVLIKLILVMPATNATSERSFSALRRVKTYLRTTMTQSRLNSLMLLHVHKEKTDSMDLSAVANDFTALHERRLAVFGHF